MKKVTLILFYFLQFYAFSQNISVEDSVKTALAFKKEGQNLIDKGKYLSSIDRLKKSIETYPKTSLEDKIRGYYLVGYAYQNSRSLDSAQFYYNKGDDYIIKSSSPLIKSQKYRNKASLKFTRSEVDSAMIYSLRALDYAVQANNKENKVNVLNGIGLIFLKQKDFLKSQQYLSESLTIAKELKDSLVIANVYNNLGQLEFEKKEFLLAETFFKDALRIFEKKQISKDVFVSKSFLLKIYYTKKEFEKSIVLSKEIIPLLNEFEYSDRLKKKVNNTNKIFKLSKREKPDSLSEKKAYKLVNESINLSEKPIIKIEENKALIQYANTRNKGTTNEENIANSDVELNRKIENTISLQDSLYQLSLESKYADIEAKYQTEKKENEILKLESDNASKELKITKESNKKLIFAVIASLALLSLGILFLYAKHRKRKLLWHSQIAVAKAKQEEHNIIGNELHDNKAKELEGVAIELKKQGQIKLSEKINAIRQDIRTLSHELTYVEFSESDFDEQIITLAANYSNSAFRIKRIGFSDVSWHSINDIVKRNLYIVIREGISNAYNHANATEMVVECSKNKKELIVKLYDNGIGFNKEHVRLGKGLTNIKVRVEEIHGKVTIESLKNKGTSIKINILLT